jgi:radical SAM superfamily enzyme YgiQ (UPF0313 family)
MKRLLLLAPQVPSDVRAWWIPGGDVPAIDTPGTVLPLGLATVAALTPEEWQVEIWDECIHGEIEHVEKGREAFDLVGITGFLPHFNRMKKIAAHFRKRGIVVVMGGPGVSAAPHLMEEHCDVMFLGEAELTWPEFLHDWAQGNHKSIYRQIGKIDMAASPPPKWDSVLNDAGQYANGAVQTTRGCPFDCEFCDVIYLYGRKQRHKPVEHVMQEISALQKMGMESVFLSDDEFAGNIKYAKALLRALIPLNNAFPRPMSYRTQLTMNVARDEEFLQLLADANFDLLVIGIETPNEESLRETGKFQNMRRDLLADVHRILSYGIGIRPGMIIGFDHDGPDIFDIQYRFIKDACIPLVSLNMLKAPIGTKLWTRMRQEGRMLDWNKMTQRTQQLNRATNIVPLKMTRPQLMRGICDLHRRIADWKDFSVRVCNMVSLVTREPRVQVDPMPVENLMTLGERLGVDEEGCNEIREIFRHVARTAPYMWKKVRSYTGSLALYRRTLDKMLDAIEQQADAEESGALKIEFDTHIIEIPRAFREHYKGVIFPAIYRRAYLNLRDRSKVDETLMESIIDFLISRPDLKEITEYDVEQLRLCVDRSCAKMNGVPPESFAPNTSEDDSVAKPVIFFADEILKSVGTELIRIAKASDRLEESLAIIESA